MSLSIIHSRAIAGLRALPVQVEADLANGLPNFSIVGLPDTAVREARDRVRAAITNSGFDFPQRRVTVNLAPADLPKDSGRFDLPIALGILVASGQIKSPHLNSLISRWEFVGELSLTGNLLPIRGAFALAMGVLHQAQGHRSLVLPYSNRDEASLTASSQFGFAKSLRDVTDFFAGAKELETISTLNNTTAINITPHLEWSDIKGQERAKRAALIAVAGGHNLLMMGAPGLGKSMIASRMPALLPPLSHQEACELASIKSLDHTTVLPDSDPSIASQNMAAVAAATWREPPYRSPHHSTPARALIGGGQPVRPGEISLAHHGILFLDELPEFSRDSLESLREPLETGEISIARVRERLRLPAKVMLVAAMNPCPCGYFGASNARRLCNCPPDRIMRYRMRISGPLLDRFDMVITLEALPPSTLLESKETANLNLELANQVAQAREIQKSRQQELNAKALIQKLDPHLELDLRSQTLLQKTAEKFGWSARAWNRVLRVARTVADLESTPSITVQHLSEAIEMRRALQL